jgi:hypothetical protein
LALVCSLVMTCSNISWLMITNFAFESAARCSWPSGKHNLQHTGQ